MDNYTTDSLAGKLILLGTILASGMAFLDGSVVNVAIPTIQEKLHATITGIQWVVNSYMLMLCALILISGALGDRFGRKKVFLYGIIVFVCASFLCSIAHSITILAIFRALQGIGGAMMVPGSLSIINSSFREEVRGRAIGLWSGFAGGISALGPFAGGWLVQTFGWQSIFYINIPIGIIALLLTLRFVPESKNNEATKIDILGAVSIFLALLGIAYGLITVSAVGWQNPFVLASLALGIIAAILFVLIEMRVKEPLVPFQMLRSSLVAGSNLTTFFLYFALSGVTFFLVLNFQQIQNFSPIIAGLALLPTILIITFLSGFGGTIADKIGPRLPMIVGPSVVALGMFLLIFPGREANYFTQFLPGLLLFGLGMALVIAPLTKSALHVAGKYSGAASGVNNAVARIAGLLAVALLGAVVVFLFEGRLKTAIASSPLNRVERQQIMTQQDKLGGIDIPSAFSPPTKLIAKSAVQESFVYGFRWAMGITAFLAALSAVISFFTIHPKKARAS
ncbi:MAG TPA: MFS transporter [Candidatus Saccharimonadales bacterium]|nr:MFS transporter [Candidatus Saccharimonadales bacterium]